MLSAPQAHKLGDVVKVVPLSTTIRVDGFPARTDATESADLTALPDQRCLVYEPRGAYSGMGSYDERMAEQFRDMGSVQYVIIFTTSPDIGGDGRTIAWMSTRHGDVVFATPKLLVTVGPQMDPGSGRYVWRVGANLLSL